MSSAENGLILSGPSVNFEPAFFQWIERAPLAQPRGAHAAHTSTGHIPTYCTYLHIKDGRKRLRTRPPDRNGGATPQSIIGKHPTRGYAASSATRRSLTQSKVRAVLVMVRDVLGKEPLQVLLVESNHMVEQLAAAAPHPTLGHTILPGTFERGPHSVYFQGSNGCRDLRPVFFIPVSKAAL